MAFRKAQNDITGRCADQCRSTVLIVCDRRSPQPNSVSTLIRNFMVNLPAKSKRVDHPTTVSPKVFPLPQVGNAVQADDMDQDGIASKTSLHKARLFGSNLGFVEALLMAWVSSPFVMASTIITLADCSAVRREHPRHRQSRAQ